METFTVEEIAKYLKLQGLGIPMENLAKIVDHYLRDYCCRGEYGYREEQEGDPLTWILQEELEIEYEPAVDLADILEDDDRAGSSYYDGDPFYRSDENYLRHRGSSGEYHQSWENFTTRIKHEGRFFDRIAKEQLASILGEADSPKAKELPCMEIGPDTRVKMLFRARLADSKAKVKTILKAPIAELGPPPAVSATPGRMNAAGISVFYGALSEDTAVAEMRPSVGSYAVVGSFKPLRKLRLLNLPQIKIGFTGSIFHPDYEDRLARFSFFKVFHTLIVRPVQPCEELLEYIPTQAVAEYVANVLGFDGILYASAQVGVSDEDPEVGSGIRVAELSDTELNQHNVALFGSAAIVKQENGEETTPGLEPVLFFQDKSAKTVMINSVKYGHKEAYIFPDDYDIGGETEIESI